MSLHHFNRSDYMRRKRYLDALLFNGKRCHVGQTVNLDRRWSEHRKAWGEPFKINVLASTYGTYSDAENHEYAWRYVAQEKRGYMILGAPGIIVNARCRMDEARYKLARKYRWPAPWWHRAGTIIAAITALLGRSSLAWLLIEKAEKKGALSHPLSCTSIFPFARL